MKKNLLLSILLGVTFLLVTTMVVFADGKSYNDITTMGYGNAVIDYGNGTWGAKSIGYSTNPYQYMDQLGRTVWTTYETCNWYVVTGTYSYLEQGTSPWLVQYNRRSNNTTYMKNKITCPINTTLRLHNAVQHWWQDNGYLADGEPIDIFSLGGTTFLDVPTSYWSYYYIEPMYQIGIMDPTAIQYRCTTNNFFCPDYTVRRDEMAYFLERGMRGSNYSFSAPTGVFSDVPTSYWNASVIEKLYADGITAGCGVNPLRFCPDSRVTRAEMAVFLLRAEHGSSYAPPPVGSSTGFIDVPTNYWAAAWIKQLAAEGITVGCNANPPYYCPESWTTRGEMAVFLSRTFAP